MYLFLGKKGELGTTSKSKLTYKEDLRDDTSDISEEDNEVQLKAPTSKVFFFVFLALL